MNIRAFIAIYPPQSWREALGETQDVLRRELKSRAFRWTPVEQIHATLRFLGNIPSAQVTDLSMQLERACTGVPPFELRAAGLGCFPSAKRPRVLWAGLRSTSEDFDRLHARLTQATASFGEPPESRPFKAHLTLARIEKAPRMELRSLPSALETPLQVDPWRVSEVLLMRSHLSPSGARYEILTTFRLARADFSPSIS